MRLLFGRFYQWLFEHPNGLDLMRHKAFVFFCLIKILYSTSCFLIALNDPRTFDTCFNSFILSLAINPIAIICSKYDLKKTCIIYLSFSMITISFYLFKFSSNMVTYTVTPMIYMTTALVATLVLSRTWGMIFFLLSAASILISLSPTLDLFIDRLPAPNLSNQDVLFMNGIYLTYTFFFISYAVSLFLKYHKFYIDESNKVLEYNSLLIDSNKNLSELNCELEENIKALEDANTKLHKYAWVNNHEVRAPLATLMGLTYVLESNIENECDRRKTIDYIKKTSSELDEVVKKLNTILNAPCV